ncbi:trypsin alpha-3-like [Bacillus rossius redtenbacheri]|uniref:trypsin alpha-3-like n=1 Tax=Bacillus rossius redtenbacheri TaxID=93214 RepID=UPI002FDD5221
MNILIYAIILRFLMSCHGSVVPLGVGTQTRIIDGSVIDIEKAPYQAQYEHIGIPTCGATIISPAYALTAAHCTIRSIVSLVTIRVGSSTRAHGGSMHDAVFIIRHERYSASPTIEYDIAIVRVAAVFMYNERVQPLKMATAAPQAGASALVAGWGAAAEGGQPSAELREARVSVLGRAACNSSLEGRLGEASLCAGHLGAGSGLGDRDLGGGLVSGGELVGVASWRGPHPSSPGVYADVAALRGWVYANCGI